MSYQAQPLVKYTLAYMRILFRDAVSKCLSAEGVDHSPVTEYISDLMYDSIRSENFFVQDSDGNMFETPVEMITIAEHMNDVGDVSAEYDIRVRTGDYALMMLGMFHKSHPVASLGPKIFSDCGRYSYERAQTIMNDVFGHSGETFTAMADFFPDSVKAIRSMMRGGELLNSCNDLDSWIPVAESLGEQ